MKSVTVMVLDAKYGSEPNLMTTPTTLLQKDQQCTKVENDVTVMVLDGTHGSDPN